MQFIEKWPGFFFVFSSFPLSSTVAMALAPCRRAPTLRPPSPRSRMHTRPPACLAPHLLLTCPSPVLSLALPSRPPPSTSSSRHRRIAAVETPRPDRRLPPGPPRRQLPSRRSNRPGVPGIGWDGRFFVSSSVSGSRPPSALTASVGLPSFP